MLCLVCRVWGEREIGDDRIGSSDWRINEDELGCCCGVGIGGIDRWLCARCTGRRGLVICCIENLMSFNFSKSLVIVPNGNFSR